MQRMRIVIPNLVVAGLAACLLAACSAPQSQADAQAQEQSSAEPAPVDPAEVPPPLPEDARSGSGEAPQGKRAAGQENEPLLAYRVVGTEPFWSGEIAGGEAVWTTPEVMAGTRFRVDRFAGNNGLAFTGRMGAETFDVMVTAGRCSDGMSDRSYPYIATVKLGDRQLEGCAWTDRQAFTGPAAP